MVVILCRCSSASPVTQHTCISNTWIDKYVHTHTTGALHLIFLKAPNLSRNPEEADRKCQHLAINSSWGGKEKLWSGMRNPSSSFTFCRQWVGALRISLCRGGTEESLKGAEGIRAERRKVDVTETGDVWKSYDLLMLKPGLDQGWVDYESLLWTVS